MNARPKRDMRRTLHRNSVVAVEENLRGQTLHGRRRTWHRNAKLATEEFYFDGLLHGVVRQWNEKGRLLGSFRMEHGTGTQKSWHDNGQLNQELATIAGEFCGRSRMWLRDGTLISDRVVLFGHVVGAGKTYTMVAAAMELKRLGLARKPMFAVPNHMLGQFSTELLMLYPGANILVAGKEDFESQNRKKLFSRIATGNWDAVIVTHSGFERIPLSQETQVRFFQEQLDELDKIKREHASPDNRRLVKELEKARKRLEAKLESLAATHKKDNTLAFEELGIDRLFVDEAHYLKNLFYISKMTRIAGLPQTASERAFDMFLKVRHV